VWRRILYPWRRFPNVDFLDQGFATRRAPTVVRRRPWMRRWSGGRRKQIDQIPRRVRSVHQYPVTVRHRSRHRPRARRAAANTTPRLADLPSDCRRCRNYARTITDGRARLRAGADIRRRSCSARCTSRDTVLAQSISQCPASAKSSQRRRSARGRAIALNSVALSKAGIATTMSGPRSFTPIRWARRQLQRAAARARLGDQLADANRWRIPR